MIKGHGDDAYRYEDIRSDFSSNICVHEDHQDLMAHLASHPELISHYPEPEAWSLEKMIAKQDSRVWDIVEQVIKKIEEIC